MANRNTWNVADPTHIWDKDKAMRRKVAMYAAANGLSLAAALAELVNKALGK